MENLLGLYMASSYLTSFTCTDRVSNPDLHGENNCDTERKSLPEPLLTVMKLDAVCKK